MQSYSPLNHKMCLQSFVQFISSCCHINSCRNKSVVLFLEESSVSRYLVYCFMVLKLQHLLISCLKHLLNLNFDHILSCLQSRRFPEDPGVGHQSAGRQNHQCVLSWGVSCPCYLSAAFGNLVFLRRSVHYRFESEPPQSWTRPSGVSYLWLLDCKLERLRLDCQFCVWKT